MGPAVEKRLMTLKETAYYVGLAEHTLRNRISRSAKNPLPVRPKYMGKKPFFDKKEIDRFIDGL